MENEREKAKDDLRAFADEYGLSASELKELAAEVAQELESERTVSSEVIQKDSSKLKVGWYAFEGKKFSPNPKAYPNCQGVVAWLNPDLNAPIGKRGLILTPDVIKTQCAEAYCKTEICDEEDGMTNTERLITHAEMYEVCFPAAEWCHLYSENGVKLGEGFLPAKIQLKQASANIDIINPALEKIGGTILNVADWCWTSSEAVDANRCKFALVVSPYAGCVELGDKYDFYSVRCFLAF